MKSVFRVLIICRRPVGSLLQRLWLGVLLSEHHNDSFAPTRWAVVRSGHAPMVPFGMCLLESKSAHTLVDIILRTAGTFKISDSPASDEAVL